MDFNNSFLSKIIEVNNMAIESTILENWGGGLFAWYGFLLLILILVYIILINHFYVEEKLENILSKKDTYKEEKMKVKSNESVVRLSNNITEKEFNKNYNFIDYFKEYFLKSILFLYNEVILIIGFVLSIIICIVFIFIGLINDGKVNDIISENLNDVNLLSDITYYYDVISVDVLKNEDTDEISYLIHYQKPNDKNVYNYESEYISFSDDSSSKIYFFDSEKVKKLKEHLSENNMKLNFHINNYFDSVIIEIDNSLLKNK